MERKVLGRGLEALIPTGQETARERVQMVPISQVRPSRFQPRLKFSNEKIEELAKSIKEKGIIQPVIVRQVGTDQYELIAGERRFRAAKKLELAEVPAIVRRVADADVLEMSIVENVQREDLNPVEEAKAYRRLGQEFGLTQETIAQKVGKDKSSVSNLLRILNLPEEIQNSLSENLITLGHAKALLALGDAKRQAAFCTRIIEKGLSVRQIEQLATRPGRVKSHKAVTHDLHLKNLEEKLQHALGTRIKISHGKKRGKIEIEYYSLEDLDRVLKKLGVSY